MKEKTEVIEEVNTNSLGATEVLDPIEVNENEPSPKVPWYKRKKVVAGCVAGACCLVIIGGGAAIALNQPTNTGKGADADITTVANKEEAEIKVTIDLPDWNENSTPALLEINDGISSTYQAIESKNAKDLKINLDKGTYTIKLISPINADGSIYIVSDEVKTTVDGTKREVTLPFNGTKLSAEDVTEDQIKDIQKKFEEAKEQGKIDQEIVDKINKNADAGKDARESKTDEEKEEAQETVKEEVKKNSESTGSQSSSSNSTNSTSGGSSSPGSSTSSGSSTPAHTHSWTTVYHDAVTHEEPVYSQIWVRSAVFCNKHKCEKTGRYCPVDPDCMASEHVEEIYEDRITGYKTVVDTPAWSETYCTTCGATR